MEDIKRKIENLIFEIDSLKEALTVDKKKLAITELQLKMAVAGFWDDQNNSAKVVAELKNLKDYVDDWDVVNDKINELKEFFDMCDSSFESEINDELKKIEQDTEKLKLRMLFCEKFDDASAIVEINSGAGGTEACDWASMLYRMYFRWAEDKKFSMKVLEEVRGEEAGIKNITFLIEGLRAYGMLKSERGVHRLVRISPFDANKRRHTSFASVAVLPDIKEDIDIEIKPEDLKVDTYRASGAGGQHVNKTESAIRITHLATGIIVASQSERSQHQNRQVAMRVLKAKLYELKQEEKQNQLNKISGDKRKIEWGSQIRSYVLHPYLLVKDHRTDFEEHNAWAVLDGKIDELAYTYLTFIAKANKN